MLVDVIGNGGCSRGRVLWFRKGGWGWRVLEAGWCGGGFVPNHCSVEQLLVGWEVRPCDFGGRKPGFVGHRAPRKGQRPRMMRAAHFLRHMKFSPWNTMSRDRFYVDTILAKVLEIEAMEGQ